MTSASVSNTVHILYSIRSGHSLCYAGTAYKVPFTVLTYTDLYRLVAPRQLVDGAVSYVGGLYKLPMVTDLLIP